MKNELNVLIKINNDGNATQRDIARTTGISLGNVNVLIKRLVNKGLLKIEKINPRTIRYILTPKGFREKTEATYRYVIDSFRMIQEVSKGIEVLLDSTMGYNGSGVILFGEKDELYHLIAQKLNEKNVAFLALEKLDDTFYSKENLGEYVIIVWSPQFYEILNREGIEHINLLDTIWGGENEAQRI